MRAVISDNEATFIWNLQIDYFIGISIFCVKSYTYMYCAGEQTKEKGHYFSVVA